MASESAIESSLWQATLSSSCALPRALAVSRSLSLCCANSKCTLGTPTDTAACTAACRAAASLPAAMQQTSASAPGRASSVQSNRRAVPSSSSSATQMPAAASSASRKAIVSSARTADLTCSNKRLLSASAFVSLGMSIGDGIADADGAANFAEASAAAESGT